MATTRIREMRKALGITQDELARRVARPQTYVSQMERPGYQPRLDTLQRVAKALGCTVAELIGERV